MENSEYCSMFVGEGAELALDYRLFPFSVEDGQAFTADSPPGWSPLPPLVNGGVPISRTTRPVRPEDVTHTRRVRLDSVARYLHDISQDDLQACGSEDAHHPWAARRIVIDVLRTCKWPSTMTLTRWCARATTRWLSIRVQLTDEHGGIIETETHWTKINPITGLPGPISADYLTRLTDGLLDTGARWMVPTTPARDDLQRRPFPLRASDADVFGRINASVYLQAVEHELHRRQELVDKPHRMTIDHHSTIRLDTPVQLLIADDADAVDLTFDVRGKPYARARVSLI